MTGCNDDPSKTRLQNRIAKVVWGFFFIGIGTLFTLQNLGKIELAHTPFPTANAVDGDPHTRWSSSFRKGQWLTVDLGYPTEIQRLKLNWEGAFAKDYEIAVSDDNTSWSTVQTVTESDGGIDELTLSARGRYVRVLGTKRATRFGISLWELEVYGPEGLLSARQKTMASSQEGADYFALVWPLALFAAGLPMILAPKDSGNQVVGVAMTSVGAFFALHNHGLTSMPFGRFWPILLIASGVILLLHSMRGTAGPDGDTGAAGSAQ